MDQRYEGVALIKARKMLDYEVVITGSFNMTEADVLGLVLKSIAEELKLGIEIVEVEIKVRNRDVQT